MTCTGLEKCCWLTIETDHLIYYELCLVVSHAGAIALKKLFKLPPGVDPGEGYRPLPEELDTMGAINQAEEDAIDDLRRPLGDFAADAGAWNQSLPTC